MLNSLSLYTLTQFCKSNGILRSNNQHFKIKQGKVPQEIWTYSYANSTVTSKNVDNNTEKKNCRMFKLSPDISIIQSGQNFTQKVDISV